MLNFYPSHMQHCYEISYNYIIDIKTKRSSYSYIEAFPWLQTYANFTSISIRVYIRITYNKWIYTYVLMTYEYDLIWQSQSHIYLYIFSLYPNANIRLLFIFISQISYESAGYETGALVARSWFYLPVQFKSSILCEPVRLLITYLGYKMCVPMAVSNLNFKFDFSETFDFLLGVKFNQLNHLYVEYDIRTFIRWTFAARLSPILSILAFRIISASFRHWKNHLRSIDFEKKKSKSFA